MSSWRPPLTGSPSAAAMFAADLNDAAAATPAGGANNGPAHSPWAATRRDRYGF